MKFVLRRFALGLLCSWLTLTTVQAEKLVLVAGGGSSTNSGVPALQAQLKEPFAVGFDGRGNMFIVEMASGQRVLKMNPQGLIEIIAGNGEKGASGDDGPAKAATFNGMHNLAVLPNGDLLLADTWNCRIRKIDHQTGIITTIAGTGVKGFSGDGGPALKAQLGGIYSISLGPKAEKLFMADLHNLRVRVMDLKTGLIQTIAGNGKKGVPADGSDAASSPLSDPRAVAADSQGNVYILERDGHALRVVNREGKIKTVVNASGKKGATGDGGPALDATMNGPKHICVDREDNVLIADAENHLIRKYLPKEGKIIRVAGTGKKGTAGLGGAPEQAELYRPHGVTVTAAGELYITDSYNNRILKIER